MADSYSIIDGQVIPYSGGRKHTDTNSWRDATEIEVGQLRRIEQLESAIEMISIEADYGKSSDSVGSECCGRIAEILSEL